MALRRGFKTEAESTSLEVRGQLGLRPLDPLDPRVLAEFLDIPIWELSDLSADRPGIGHLLTVEPDAFSAVTVFRGRTRTIVHNDAHNEGRRNSNLAHELAHGLLLHPPTPALDDKGCRDWNQDIEDEAAWLSAILLVPEAVALEVAKGRWTRDQACEVFGISGQMLQFRLNVTGAFARAARMRNYRRSGQGVH